ncbi:hypothetical protein IJ076_02165 [Candidatus Saccharibacteria bacterium]|nr:hypothetical protein [Candidatus Saccharibacteria bacterium]
MLKIVVFDSGYGGELFADKLEETFPITDIIRVIDWRNADKIQKNWRLSRKIAQESLKPYIGRVDLIVFANFLLTATSLKYFRRKYKNQKFTGVNFPVLTTFIERPTVILTTSAVAHTINYRSYVFRLKRHVDTLCLDSWPPLIDDGELSEQMIYRKFDEFYHEKLYRPVEAVLICTQFCDITKELRNVLGQNLKIHDGFNDAITEVAKVLKIRGGTGRRKH